MVCVCVGLLHATGLPFQHTMRYITTALIHPHADVRDAARQLCDQSYSLAGPNVLTFIQTNEELEGKLNPKVSSKQLHACVLVMACIRLSFQ